MQKKNLKLKMRKRMKDFNVYRKKDNGRYEPFGVQYDKDYLPDGIWYVRHHDYSRGLTSVGYLQGLFKVGEKNEIDITEICGMEDLVDYITHSDEWCETLNSPKGYTLNDIVHICVKKLVDKAKEQKDKKL